MRILIAEDERGLARGLAYLLEKNNCAVDIVHSGSDALEYFRAYTYDAIVLDIMMPGLDGLSVLAEIRKGGSAVPVMLLTAKSSVEDKVNGLELGADDYLAKPFSTREFVARVRALLRRSNEYFDSILTLGNTRLDCNKYSMCHGENCVTLNNKEFQLAEMFFRHPGYVFSSEYLMRHLWPDDTNSNIDVVWTYIGYIRRKMKQLESDAEIVTVRGAGYKLEARI